MSSSVLPKNDHYRDLVRREWNDPETVAGWKRWFPKMLDQFRSGTDLLLETARLERGMQVLDIASGSGDPALALAEAVGPTGSVIATDDSVDMLALAEDHATERGLTNISFRTVDAHDLPFPDEQFDRVVSKLGVMYFVDCNQALREVKRVLRPDGRIAFLAWGPPDQSPYIQAALGPILQRAQLPPPPPDAPQPFRFATSGTLTAELERAGFHNVEETSSVITLAWPGPPEEVWQHLYDIAAPFRPVIDGLEPGAREQAIGEVLTGLRAFYDGERTITPAAVVIASATF